ncbi:MAG: methyltransferase domain-containing protein [Desulfobacteraceae bacterium]|nr:methyltransferase domain-containing protein [Desulfobacteraceae bacterium]
MLTGKDRNFDDLAPRFNRKVYGGLKGRIRLAVLEKDFNDFLIRALNPPENQPLKILDAGGGHGPFSLRLAKQGHNVTLCDVSEKMLELAGKRVGDQGLEDRVTLVQSPIQDLPSIYHGPYDLVLCHAVLGWVAEPEVLILHLSEYIKPNGMLSLTFYNIVGMIYKNLLRANYKKIVQKQYAGWPGSLTPMYPRHPEDVLNWLGKYPFEILCHSGMRVFHDYILDLEDREQNPSAVVDLELEFSRQTPYRDMGRYQHIMAQKKA